MMRYVGDSFGEAAAPTLARTYAGRLDFRLPPFFRMAWATPTARDRWSEPLARLAHDVRTAEWMSVADGLRLAAIVAVPQDQATALSSQWSHWQLGSYRLGPDDATQIHALAGKMAITGPSHELHLVTHTKRLGELEVMWKSPALIQLAGWLGYPSCCAAFLETVAVGWRCLETAWAMVRDPTYEENGAQIAQPIGYTANPLLSALGLRATPHRPCGFCCEATQGLAVAYSRLRALADQTALEEVLSWPVEWSQLHGIVEVRLPILKFCHDGDATAGSYKVRLTGATMPEHAARGLDFPYIPATRPTAGAVA